MLEYSEACERNKEPILNILKDAFILCSSVLEIGSGTGQHAVYFGMNLPHLVWQPSDLSANLPALRARIDVEGTDNVSEPVELDVNSLPWWVSDFDGVFTANTLHIMPSENTVKLFEGLNDTMVTGGVLCIYGPFKYNGKHTSESNRKFDEFLRTRDPRSGIRDFEYVNGIANRFGFTLVKDHDMPANNRCIVWKKKRARLTNSSDSDRKSSNLFL